MKIRKILDKGDVNNKKIAYEFFVKEKGYSPKVALGIVGNLMQESHPNLVTTVEGFDGKGSYGIAQWLGSRKEQLKKIRPKDYNTLKGQLEFIDWELRNTEKRAGIKLKQAKSIEDAALIFSKYYERPHKDYAHNDKRISYAKNLSKELGIVDNSIKEDKKYREDYPEQRIDNTYVNKNTPVNYTTLPETEVEKQKPITEEDIRKILEEEKNNNIKQQEDRFLKAFTQPQQEIENTQQFQPQDLSHLYNYIQPTDDSFYTQGFTDGGKLNSGPEHPANPNELINSFKTNKEFLSYKNPYPYRSSRWELFKRKQEDLRRTLGPGSAGQLSPSKYSFSDENATITYNGKSIPVSEILQRESNEKQDLKLLRVISNSINNKF